ncbi:hypothetical protein L5M36_16105 [Shewanella sp. SM72]|uniref:hypothetical protein n=1 Tax=unclassified Shewanella TaxID=196818 RepID=UPI0021D837AE|nr:MULTISPECIES: hypothetical protein [unclassified Shewanella]MCU8018404.1 hypothetical protein [Shewanella sp. SM72]MCU8062070.1 hypothetical protein [Shewanella sp. SM55]MCU8087480.1 hypothetical protein [Shewanella sp. SM21]
MGSFIKWLLLSTITPVTRHKLVPEGSTAASMPPTVTAARVLNSADFCVCLYRSFS